MSSNRPDRPIPVAAQPIRALLRFWRLAWLRLRLRRRLTVGRNVTFGRAARLMPPGYVRIGDNVAIGADFHVETNLEIGPDVLISSRVAMVGRDHRFDNPSQSVFWAGRPPAELVVLEGDNLIGYGTIIVAPVRIGRGCIVGAGSVVVGDLPGDTICAGAPAKPIRGRYEPRA